MVNLHFEGVKWMGIFRVFNHNGGDTWTRGWSRTIVLKIQIACAFFMCPKWTHGDTKGQKKAQKGYIESIYQF